MEFLPYEKLLEIALYLPIKDILSLCKTNTYLRRICNDDFFWHQKLRSISLKIKAENFDMNNKNLVVLFEKMMNRINLHAEDIGILVQKIRKANGCYHERIQKTYNDEELVEFLIEIYNGDTSPLYILFGFLTNVTEYMEMDEFFYFVVKSIPYDNNTLTLFRSLTKKSILKRDRKAFAFLINKQSERLKEPYDLIYAIEIGKNKLSRSFLQPLLDITKDERKDEVLRAYDEGYEYAALQI